MKRIVLLAFAICVGQPATAQLAAYPAPKGSILSTYFTVKVREAGKSWQPLPVYPAHVAEVINSKSVIQQTSFAYFDFSGKVEISVTYNKGAVHAARVRPLREGINPGVKGNTISFFLTEPKNLSIEVNGDLFHNLNLFASPPDVSPPSAQDTSVIYYGPGIHYAGKKLVPSNKTVYLAGGAIVQGSFVVNRAQNVKIRGRGILTQVAIVQESSGKPLPRDPGLPGNDRSDEITVQYSKNVEIEGLIVVPDKYSVLVGQSAGVTIRNFKSFSAGGNADGLDIFSSTDVVIDRVFMRNADDCIAIYGHRWGYYGNLTNLTVTNSILWADVAHPVLIGTHGDSRNPDTLSNIRFHNIDILDQFENQVDYQGCLSLNAGDSNFIRDVSFEDIRIDDIRKGQLVNLRIMFNSKYNTSAGRGIENVHFKNISYNGSRANLSIIAGYDQGREIRNVTFENLVINGRVIYDNMTGKPAWYKTGDMANFFIGEHVKGIKFLRVDGAAEAKSGTGN
ncbi:glycosyl hydrolase family 28 protein [Hufsiella ginkgonis]|uniref:Endo-polygalacturonase n=1 Tax=Hufsiella ginkgonis TaxID=2695274 RepID=A0A7K1XZZ4_9SPHI|nr:glycosyl hydrolase family 28 protein [Hufsiella ginkgonis]MXV16387.1 endo-polygalacturonase [Hufsiella ginkgonis]